MHSLKNISGNNNIITPSPVITLTKVSITSDQDQVQHLQAKLDRVPPLPPIPASLITKSHRSGSHNNSTKFGLQSSGVADEMSIKKILFQKRNKYLHFVLDKTPFEVACYKIDEEYQSLFLSKITEGDMPCTAVTAQFSDSLSNLQSAPDKKTLVEIAKTAVLIGYHFGEAGVISVEKIIAENYGGVADDLVKRMTLVYLIHLIMTIETVSDLSSSLLERSYCKTFEQLLCTKGIFRLLVRQVPLHQKEELYSLRKRWELYFSEKGLLLIDRNFLWFYEGRGLAANPIDYQEMTDETEELETNINADEDNLSILNETIESLLDSDWIIEFPLNEEAKRRLTTKYSIPKSSGSNAVYLYDTRVGFSEATLRDSIAEIFRSPDKNKLIAGAKESLYVDKVFGENKAAVVAELLTNKMSGVCINGEKEIKMREKLTALLLVHVILCGEATNDSNKSKLKATKSYSKLFSTSLFVLNFQNLVRSLKSKLNRRKLYWMRQIWNSFLVDKYLSKIDSNFFWERLGIEASPLPDRMNLKRATLSVLVPNSDEEVTIIAHVDKSKCQEEEPVIEIHSSDEDTEECDDEVVFVTEKKNKIIAKPPENSKNPNIMDTAHRCNSKDNNEVDCHGQPLETDSVSTNVQSGAEEGQIEILIDSICEGTLAASNSKFGLNKYQRRRIQSLKRRLDSILDNSVHGTVGEDSESFCGTRTRKKRKQVASDLNQQDTSTKKQKIDLNKNAQHKDEVCEVIFISDESTEEVQAPTTSCTTTAQNIEEGVID